MFRVAIIASSDIDATTRAVFSDTVITDQPVAVFPLQALDYDLDSFGNEALLLTKKLIINSMCTVFAESEVTTLITRGEKRQDIALGLHAAVVQRAVNMLRRVWAGGPVIFAGGVARNSCIRHLLAEHIGQEILVPEDPQMVGALGAALLVSSDVSDHHELNHLLAGCHLRR